MEIICKNMEDGIQQFMEFAGDEVLLQYKKNLSTDNNIKTGKLYNSGKVIKRIGEVSVRIETEYASYIEEGTKPHLIVPRNKKALAFETGKKKIITRKVRHPGTQPYRTLENAVYMFLERFRG
jgi:hypothetical protein